MILSAIRKQLEDLFRDVIGFDGELSASSGPDHVASWTSLNHINLIVEVEEELEVSFSAEEASEIATFGKLLDLVEVKLRGSS